MDIFRLVGSIFIDTDKANESLKKTGEGADNVASKLGQGAKKAGEWAGGVAVAAAGVATAIGVKAVNAASDFEDSFAKVNTLLSDDTILSDYKQSIIDLSNQMGVSTGEISEAVYSAISAGVDEAEAVEFVSNSMKLAQGGFTSTTTAVDVLTTALNAYGEESGLTAEKVSDMLITTQNLGKTTVDELGSSLGKVIPTAKAFGVQLDDVAGMYATMTKNGVATAESGTYIRSMLNELGKSGTKASDALHKATEHIKEGGLSFSEMMEQGWELTDVLSLLDDQAAETGVSMLDMFGSAEAGNAASILWDKGAELNEIIEEMGNSAGSTEEAFDVMHDTLSTKVATIQQNFENMCITLGETVIPIVMQLMDVVMDFMPTLNLIIQDLGPVLVSLFDGLLPPIMELVEALLPAIVDLINQLLPFIVDIVSAVLPTMVTLLNALLPILKPILELLTPILQLVTLLLQPLMSLINTLLPPLIQLITWVAEIALKPLESTLKMVSEGFKGFLAAVKLVFEGIKPAVKGPVNAVLGFINGLIRGVSGGINSIIRSLNRLQISVPEWVTKLTGVSSFGFNIAEVSVPQIPLLAKGGVLENGSAIVGEDGPELLQTNGNRTKVTPLNSNNNEFVELGKKLDKMIDLLEHQETIIPVYIGNQQIDEILVSSKSRITMRSGGYSYV